MHILLQTYPVNRREVGTLGFHWFTDDGRETPYRATPVDRLIRFCLLYLLLYYIFFYEVIEVQLCCSCVVSLQRSGESRLFWNRLPFQHSSIPIFPLLRHVLTVLCCIRCFHRQKQVLQKTSCNYKGSIPLMHQTFHVGHCRSACPPPPRKQGYNTAFSCASMFKMFKLSLVVEKSG